MKKQPTAAGGSAAPKRKAPGGGASKKAAVAAQPRRKPKARSERGAPEAAAAAAAANASGAPNNAALAAATGTIADDLQAVESTRTIADLQARLRAATDETAALRRELAVEVTDVDNGTTALVPRTDDDGHESPPAHKRRKPTGRGGGGGGASSALALQVEDRKAAKFKVEKMQGAAADAHERAEVAENCALCCELDARRSVLFLPCKHLACCAGCAAGLSKCPWCAETIADAVPGVRMP